MKRWLAIACVDAQGETVAATAVEVEATGETTVFEVMRADRPFLFLIRNTEQDTILFLRRFVTPATSSSDSNWVLIGSWASFPLPELPINFLVAGRGHSVTGIPNLNPATRYNYRENHFIFGTLSAYPAGMSGSAYAIASYLPPHPSRGLHSSYYMIELEHAFYY